MRSADPVRMQAAAADLLAAIPAEERILVARLEVGAQRRVSIGPVADGVLLGDAPERPEAIIILVGVLVREIIIGGRSSSQLYGPGDVIRPWSGPYATLAHECRWTCKQASTVALLDRRFSRVAARWPAVAARLRERIEQQADAQALHAAIVGLPRAEQRVLALLWLLADRWGTVTASGVKLEMVLTHALIGQLVAARRPTVSLAIQTLVEDGLLARTQTGEWLLTPDSHTRVETLPRLRPAAA